MFSANPRFLGDGSGANRALFTQKIRNKRASKAPALVFGYVDNLLYEKPLAPLCHDQAILFVFEAFHAGFGAGRGLDRLCLAVSRKFDMIALGHSLVCLGPVKICD